MLTVKIQRMFKKRTRKEDQKVVLDYKIVVVFFLLHCSDALFILKPLIRKWIENA